MPSTKPTGPALARSPKPTVPKASKTGGRTLLGVFCALLAAAWLLAATTAAAAGNGVASTNAVANSVGAGNETAHQGMTAHQHATLTQDANVTQEANVRAQPNTSSAILTTLPAGSAVTVSCWTLGEPTFGDDQQGATWLYTTLDGWVHSYLVTPVEVPPCGPEAGIPPADPGQFYDNCDDARAAGAAPVHEGEPGYGPHLDADNDGVGCELSD
jgi:hypothetical protein